MMFRIIIYLHGLQISFCWFACSANLLNDVHMFSFISGYLGKMNNSTVIETTNGTGCPGNCRRATIFTPEIFFIYNLYLSITLFLGITGNGLVLAVFAKYKASTSTDWFIIFITIFDFISSIFNVPIYLTFTTGHWQTIGNDIFCKVHMFVSQSVVL